MLKGVDARAANRETVSLQFCWVSKVCRNPAGAAVARRNNDGDTLRGGLLPEAVVKGISRLVAQERLSHSAVAFTHRGQLDCAR